MRSPRWAGRCRPHRPGRTIQREDTASGPIASRVTPGSIRPTSILTGQSQTSQIQTHRWLQSPDQGASRAKTRKHTNEVRSLTAAILNRQPAR
ncbi:hypothetical protein ACFFX0_04005 [Citricoccus parietis]|uniref:Uncharacterized protein n=1 Tax=Citricoccus parietis TaxID=592307 RepID=A0ABV5FUQ4_9MICC